MHPQIKICGLTEMASAIRCAEMGANAVGLNFYPGSPRYIEDDVARKIATALPSSVSSVGVFVNCTFSHIMQKVENCLLNAVQLHGQESPALVRRLVNEGLKVIKVLFIAKEPRLSVAGTYNASAFLIEHGGGKLPGGNARTWDWSDIRQFSLSYPLILAGGLAPGNVADAILMSKPDAVDVSSGVESSPGIKDMKKVEAFINAVTHSQIKGKSLRNIF